MRLQAGAVLDPYDDGFSSLPEFFRGRTVPSFIKTASILDDRLLQALPDHAFAVVLVDDQKQLRKYACVDKAHTAVNVMYFLENRDELPPTARVKTASNLIKACRHFDLQPPVELVKTAQMRKRLIKSDGAEITVPVRPEERLAKESDLSGTAVMPNSARPTAAKRKVASGSIMDSPYVRLADEWDPRERQAPPMVKQAAQARTYEELEDAITFFQEMGGEMHPQDRHKMCVKLAAQADTLGVPVSEVIRKYGSTEYADPDNLEASLQTRRQVWAAAEDTRGPGLLDLLMEKKASLGPERFAETLAEIDAMTQIDHYWNNGVPDPWIATFGPQKVAGWSWSKDGVSLDEQKLQKLANSQLIKEKFGEDLAAGLKENPTVVFDSLPMDTQKVIARMAS